VRVARRSPLETFEVNVQGAWNVFDACRTHEVARVIFASSDKAYGHSPELPYREDFPLRAVYPYDASKAAADTIARSYATAYGLPLAVTRFANVYGGGDLNFSRLIPEATVALLEGRPPVIRSDGSPERDFIHVDDAVSAYLAILGALDGGASGEAFNAGGERPHSVREVVELIVAAAGSGVEPDFQGAGNPDGEIDRQFVDSTKLRELTGWRPEVELEDGLRRTLEWYRGHPEARPAKVSV
jgi:CDP-glucose 4,6-dehydratase